jgi:hypothetical protein
MSVTHPDDQMLERYRNHSLTPELAGRLEGHVTACATCRNRLEAFSTMDRRLSEFPMENPSEGFTDRLMMALPALEDSRRFLTKAHGTSPSKKRRQWLFRPELANALVATAATYLFISSGILETVLSLDPGRVEYGIHTKLALVLDWVDRLAKVIPS